eukprot:1660865-Lingulodinium_polyedra.AAC.1
MLLENVVITIGGTLPEDLRVAWTKLNGKRPGAGGGAGQGAAAAAAGMVPGPGGRRSNERDEERLAAWIAQHGP